MPVAVNPIEIRIAITTPIEINLINTATPPSVKIFTKNVTFCTIGIANEVNTTKKIDATPSVKILPS